MKHLTILSIFLLVGLSAKAQDPQFFRTSLLQYQFNMLPINPAYAGRTTATSFDATYFGSFASGSQLTRSSLVSLSGRGGIEGQFGLGSVLLFSQQAGYNELNFRPAMSKLIQLDNGVLSFGGTLGFSYFDVDETVGNFIGSSFFSLDAGAGVFFHNDRSFVGASWLSFFEKSFNDDDLTGLVFERSSPINLHAGSLFQLTDAFFLKPVFMVRYATSYGLPSNGGLPSNDLLALDTHTSLFVEGAYSVGLLAGYTHPQAGFDQYRLGASATVIFGRLRLGYAVQYNGQSASSLSLPTTHMLTAGYDFYEDGEAGRRVF